MAPPGGEDFDDAKGTGTNRHYKEFAVRIATCHKIPAVVYKDDWEAAIERVQAGEETPSESEEDEPPVTRKGKARANAPKRPASVSEIEAESSDDSDSDGVDPGILELIELKVKPEDDDSGVPKSCRRSSRLSLKRDQSDHDSDVEEIPGFGEFDGTHSRKRTASPSFDLDVSDSEGHKHIRSTSRGSHYDVFNNEDPLSPRLGPTTSSFSFDPAVAVTCSPVNTSSTFSFLPLASSGPAASTSSMASGSALSGPSPSTSLFTANRSAAPRRPGAAMSMGPSLRSYIPTPRAALKVPETKYNPYA
ncbi:hypothetical protein DFH09DRAFT_1067802 [Mycena vulgaris]|nr:hypothetical protein DFH09DRAFT_1067802 [Mycena vulgaris]